VIVNEYDSSLISEGVVGGL